MKPSSRKPFSIHPIAIRGDGAGFAYGGGSSEPPCPVVLSTFKNKPKETILNAHKKGVIELAYRTNNELVSCSFDSQLCIWSEEGELLRTNEYRTSHRADGFAITSDQRHCLIGEYNGEVSVFDMESLERVSGFRVYERLQQIWCVACEPAGNRFLVGGAGGKVLCYQFGNESPQWVAELGWGHHIWGIEWFTDGDRFLMCSNPDGAAERGSRSEVAIRDANDGARISTYYPGGPQPYCCAQSPNGRFIVAAGGRTDRGGKESRKNCTVQLWDVEAGETPAVLIGHTQLVRSVAFTQDSKHLLSGGQDRTLRCWDVESAVKEQLGT
ncbi:WD40 repeat domain-containing protein [Roseiconus lacunae]|uniref:WD40 repeat domain-containing protein n=1 Tax=Roseiconus lacunae TaxID=2605694 RepID=A0ABT7PSF8_9BACT|nr:WD40 repeat domain-containing protein [Roseiconus lacunae]MDM4019450.1 WD40 repeat domain-containing protein [Roseiconus lacunae]